MSRLIEGRIQDGPTAGGTQKWQSYSYDPFGNIQSIGGTSGRSTPTSSSTNRLTGATAYDSAGNLTNWNTSAYEYDRFNQMTRMLAGAEDWRYVGRLLRHPGQRRGIDPDGRTSTMTAYPPPNFSGGPASGRTVPTLP